MLKTLHVIIHQAFTVNWENIFAVSNEILPQFYKVLQLELLKYILTNSLLLYYYNRYSKFKFNVRCISSISGYRTIYINRTFLELCELTIFTDVGILDLSDHKVCFLIQSSETSFQWWFRV
jgi:hypothetical protein